MEVKRVKSYLLPAVSGFLALIFSVLGVIGAVDFSDKKSEAMDPVRWIMCSMWGEESIPAYIYLATQSDSLAYSVLSKSTLNSGQESVDFGLNSILEIAGFDFKKTNEKILGRSLDPGTGVDTDPKKDDPKVSANEKAKKNYNKGPQVNLFDRFGVAGLSFSGYAGEWKYLSVKVCQDVDPIDTKTNVFYTGRLEPLSTLQDVPNSKDIRSLQYGGFGRNFLINTSDNIANGLFTITKILVVVTVVLIGFSFSDITSVMGITDVLANDSGGGIFGSLYNGFFIPLIVIAIALTGVSIGIKALVKREFRGSMNILLRTLAMFFGATIFALFPGTIIAIPNAVAVYTQSVIMTSMNGGLTGGGGLCESYSGDLITDTGSPQADLTKAAANMQSAVGCQFWYNFLLRPWAKGQFGVEWNELFANGKVPTWAPQGSQAIKSDSKNEEFVKGEDPLGGLAAVPIGNKKYLNNWALLQISTQTNAHGPITMEGQASPTFNGAAADWWRIVDVLSNYTESTKTQNIGGDGSGKDVNSEISYILPDAANPLPQWDTWVGNSAYNRIGVALMSLLVAGFGLAGPLIFSMLASVYAFGTAFLMAIAPIMLLFGCWAEKGFEMFKGWAELVINTFLKRIGMGLLLALSISITTTVLNMMTTVGWAQGVLMLVVLSLVLISSKSNLINLLQVQFSNGAFKSSTDKFTSGLKKAGSTVGSIGTSAAAGAITSKRYGGSLADGALSGAKTDLKNKLYRSRVGREAMSVYQSTKGFDNDDPDQSFCGVCGKDLQPENISGDHDNIVGQMEDGRYCCKECLDDGAAPGAIEVIFNDRKETREESVYDSKESKIAGQDLEELKNKHAKSNGNESDLDEKDKKKIVENVTKLSATAASELRHAAIRESASPDIPEQIRPYLDENVMRVAWETATSKNPAAPDDAKIAAAFIQEAYAAAFYKWATETFAEAFIEQLDAASSMDNDEVAYSNYKTRVQVETPYRADNE